MDDQSLFYLPPEPLGALTRNLQRIVIERSTGERIAAGAQGARLTITQEHTSVERMQDDWGAICEVFKQNAFYYVTIAGISLQAGDSILLFYTDGRSPLALQVIELENGRARIEDPL